MPGSKVFFLPLTPRLGCATVASVLCGSEIKCQIFCFGRSWQPDMKGSGRAQKRKKKPREGENWSKAETGLGQEPGEQGRAEPTSRAPELSRERLFSLQLSTELGLAAACTEGRWAPCPGAPSLVGASPQLHSLRSQCCSQIPGLSPSPEELRRCHQLCWGAPSSATSHRTPAPFWGAVF